MCKKTALCTYRDVKKKSKMQSAYTLDLPHIATEQNGLKLHHHKNTKRKANIKEQNTTNCATLSNNIILLYFVFLKAI